MAEIKVGSVSLPFYPHPKGWRFAFKDAGGKWCYVTRRDKAEAMELARAKARELSNGAVDIGALDADKAALVRRVLALGITHADLDAWQQEKQRPALSTSEAIAEFLSVKRANRGPSLRNIRSLQGDLSSLEAHAGHKPLRLVSVADLESWLATCHPDAGAWRRKNLRGSAVTFFRWCRKRGLLGDGTTAAERMECPRIVRKVPSTWTPAEMRLLLTHCPSEYLPWLVLAGFAGLRYEEIFADPHSDKLGLDWSDFHWQRGIIIVRAETAKTGERRIIPILPVVKAWLHPLRRPAGRLVPVRPPYKVRKNSPSLTAILGEHVGGWRTNALRHSFISYRAAMVGIAQTAMEAGNSEAESRRSYHDAMSKADAEQWFGLLPP